MVSVRSPRTVLAVAASLLLGAGCANRGMEAPTDLPDSSGAGGATVTDAGPDHPASTGGAAGTNATGGAGGGAGAGDASARGGSGGSTGSGGSGGASTGGTGGAATGGAAGQMNTGGAGAGGGAGKGAAGSGGASTGGTGGAATGGAAGQMNTGGAGAGGGAGKGAAGTGGASTGGAGGSGGAGAGGSGGAGGQALPPLFAYYPFDQTAGPTIADASGNGHAGTLVGAGTFPAGFIGTNALSLPGTTGDYVALPSALLQSVTSVTITLWVNVRTDHTWQRVFDFGSSASVYMFLTPHASTGNVARFAISTGGINSEQRLDAPAVLPLGTWTHVAIVLGAGGGALYLNGAPVATNASLILRPADLGAAANDWLGRSQFTADPAFDGQIDDLRIYASALTAAQVTAIYNAR